MKILDTMARQLGAGTSTLRIRDGTIPGYDCHAFARHTISHGVRENAHTRTH